MNHFILGFRSLRRTPLLWASIVLTLGLALAATVLVFSLINAYLIRPLPYGDSSRLAVVYEYSLKSGLSSMSRLIATNTTDLEERLPSLSRIANVINASVTIHANNATEVDFVQRVTPGFFPLIGAQARLGQVISSANAESGGQHSVVLSDQLWRRSFGANPAVIGQSVQLDRTNCTIVGVLPPDFKTPTQDDNPQAWIALLPTDYAREDRSQSRYYILGELAPGRSLADARIELARAASDLRNSFLGGNADRGLTAISLREDFLGTFDRQLLFLQGAVFLVLLVACLNCLCLLLARALQRRREFAVRLALGASRRALLIQLFSESLWLALPAALFADLTADFISPLVIARLPKEFAALPTPQSDATVHLAVLVIAVAIAFLFSLVPLLQTRRLNLEAALRDGGRNLSSAGSARATRWLATGQIGVALALLIGAALLLRSYRALQTTDAGLPVATLDYFRVGLRGDVYRDPIRRQQFFDQLLDRLRQLPGVRAAAATPALFAVPPAALEGFVQESDGFTLAESPKRAMPRPVTASFRDTVDLKLIAGRWIDEHDTTGHPTVAVINAGLAHKYWPSENPIGKRVHLESLADDPVEIVGVVADTRGLGNQPAVIDSFYLSLRQRPFGGSGMGFVVRFAGSAPPARLLQQAVWSIDPDMQFFAHQPVAEIYEQSAWQTRFVLTLVGGFSTLAVALSLAGIYAVLSFIVSRRLAEFGVRMALGASASNIIRLVLRDAVRITAIGVGLGLALAWMGSRSLHGLLFHTPALDFFSYLLSALIMMAACAAAVLLPARRATQVDPISALRAE